MRTAAACLPIHRVSSRNLAGLKFPVGCGLKTMNNEQCAQGAVQFSGTFSACIQTFSACIQTLNACIQTLNACIQTLNARIQTLNARIQTLNACIQTLNARIQTFGL